MRKCFFQVEYIYRDVNGDDHFFNIGYFSNNEKARLSIKEVEAKPGFIDTLGSFKINRIYVDFNDSDVIKAGAVLYEVSHEYLDSDGYDNFTIFGVYATYEEAKKVESKKRSHPDFCKHSEGFCISTVKVDLCEWKEGFSPW